MIPATEKDNRTEKPAEYRQKVKTQEDKAMKNRFAILLTVILLLCAAFGAAAGETAEEEPIRVHSWSELRNTLYQAPVYTWRTIILDEEITAGSDDWNLSVGQKKKIILDLNGHTLNRNLTQPNKDGAVIAVFSDAYLIIRDSSAGADGIGDGVITGGYGNYTAGGIRMHPDAHVTLESGRIEGNRTNAQYAGGVDVQGIISQIPDAVFTMKGGVIQNNTGGGNGGGVRAAGVFYLKGGIIRNNTAAKRGGGVYVESYGTIVIEQEDDSKVLRITDNNRMEGNKEKPDNLCVPKDVPFALRSFNPENVRIGITSEATPTVETPLLITSTSLADDEGRRIASDYNRYETALNENGQVILGIPLTLKFQTSGGKGKMEDMEILGGNPFILPECGFTPPADGSEFSGWIINGSEYAAGDSVTLTADATAVAMYGDVCAITLNAGDGTGEDIVTTAIRGRKFTMPGQPDSFSAPEGMAFMGWIAEGETEVLEPGEEITADSSRIYTAQWTGALNWTQLAEALKNAKSGDTIRLYNDVSPADSTEAAVNLKTPSLPKISGKYATVTLDLNGHTVDRGLAGSGTSYGYAIEIEKTTLVIRDTSRGGKGAITGGNGANNKRGGGIRVGDGRLVLQGGGILGNKAYNGGGVMLNALNAVFEMQGGHISNNTADNYGGGVFVYQGTFTMTGGEIDGNDAGSGGAVWADMYNRVNLYGGTIHSNSAETIGGVRIDGGAQLYMHGAPEIYNNPSAGDESDLYLGGQARININGTMTNTVPINVMLERDIGIFTDGLPEHGSERHFSAAKENYDVSVDPETGEGVLGDLITISFDPNGAYAGSMRPEKAVRGGLYVLPEIDPVNRNIDEGFIWPSEGTFAGWLMPDGELRRPLEIVSFTEDTTLRPKWEDRWTLMQEEINNCTGTIVLHDNLYSNVVLRYEYACDQLVIPQGADVTIDLNGYTIDRRLQTSSDCDVGGSAFRVEGKLTIMDSSPAHTGVITGGSSDKGGSIYVAPGGELILQSGRIEGNVGRQGGAVYVDHGRMTMTGGSISNNQCPIEDNPDVQYGVGGCGIFVDDGQFTMSGGTISNNTNNDPCSCGGGGVFLLGSNATMTMSGNARIVNNVSGSDGGGVMAGPGATFTMNGGLIEGNKSSLFYSGGGLYVENGATAVINDGVIRNNMAESYGGGVGVRGSLTMNGGTVTGNKAKEWGSGMSVQGTLTLSGNANVTGNLGNSGEENNIDLPEGKVIQLGEGFTGTAGFLTRRGPRTDAPVIFTAGYNAETCTGTFIPDQQECLMDVNDNGELMVGLPIVLSFNAGRGSGTMKAEEHMGMTWFRLPECEFEGPGRREFKAWLLLGNQLPADTLIRLPYSMEAVALYEEETPAYVIDDWSKLLAAAAEGGYVKLDADITGTASDANLVISKDVTLDLSGYILTLKPNAPVTVQNRAALTVTDGEPEAEHGDDADVPAGGIIIGRAEVGEDSALRLTAGTMITDGSESGVTVGRYGEFSMQGGKLIRSGSQQTGTGVRIDAYGRGYLTGGTISGFETGVSNAWYFSQSGGTIDNNSTGLSNAEGGTFVMSDGTISGAMMGVENVNSSSFLMSGGMIEEVTGNSVTNIRNSIFNMSGGTLQGMGLTSDSTGVSNSASKFYLSGGVLNNFATSLNNNGGEVIMSGGSILDSGIFVHGEGAVFTMAGGTLTEVSKGANVPGGSVVPAAINAADGAKVNLNGGIISDCQVAAIAVDQAGYATGSVLSIDDGTIDNAFGSIAGGPSASVILGDGSTLSMSGGAFHASQGAGSGPDCFVTVPQGATFTMTGGEMTATAATGVAINGGIFEQDGGRISGRQTGVSITGTSSNWGHYRLYGGTVSGCGENGVRADACGYLLMAGGAIRNNTEGTGVLVSGGMVTIFDGDITNCRTGVLVNSGDCTIGSGMIAGHTESDIEASAAGQLDITGFTGFDRVRLQENAVIHISGPTGGETIEVEALGGLGSVITEGLEDKGRAEQFVSSDPSMTAVLNGDGEVMFAYVVNFDSEPGSKVAQQAITEAGQKAVKPADPTLDNATFQGWYLDGTAFSFDTVIDRSVTLKALWEYDTFGPADFILPAGITEIEAYAFSGIAATAVDIPAAAGGQQIIRANAFDSCLNLRQVRIPDNCAIEDGAFAGCSNVVLFGGFDGAAYRYAMTHDNCTFCPDEAD